MSDRLNTAKDLLAKHKRKSEITFTPLAEKIFDVGFYIGMLAYTEFMEETIDLPKDISVDQLKLMNDEIDSFFDNLLDDKN
tara:strand:+ start:23757 stop:23999 length:243 start_codon:yes stop_codon:yes gene_type:complete